MPRLLFILVAPILLGFAASACDGVAAPASPTPEATLAPSATPRPRATLTPEATTTATTPTPAVATSPTAGPTATSAADSTPNPTPSRTPITQLIDVDAFLDEHSQDEIVQAQCNLNTAAGLVDCRENGLYEPDPSLDDANTSCTVLLIDEQPVALSCTSLEPFDMTYYTIP